MVPATSYGHISPRGSGEDGWKHATQEEMMKKLTLDLDSLTVESFQTADAQQSRGTVMGPRRS